MLKLLLREQRHIVKREYILRFFITFFVTMSFVVLIFGLLLFAPFLELSVSKNIVQKQYDEVNNSTDTKDRKDFLDLSSRLKNKNSYISDPIINQSFILKNIVEVAHEGVLINGINIQIEKIEKGKDAKIELRGVSKTRENLVDFQKKLLEKDLFTNVDVPFSNFAKSTDITFSINIKTVELVEYMKKNNHE